MSVEDHLAIQELAYLYAYYIDSFQVENWVSIFTEDAYFDEREFGSGLHVGHADIRAYGDRLTEEMLHAVHLMSNHLITDLTPTSARGTVFALVEGLSRANERLRYHVIYEDEYVKLDSRWKIRRRVLRKTFPVEVVPMSPSTT